MDLGLDGRVHVVTGGSRGLGRATAETLVAEGARVVAREHPHGATTALSFRIEDAGKTFVYASDVGYPETGPSAEIARPYPSPMLTLGMPTLASEK